MTSRHPFETAVLAGVAAALVLGVTTAWLDESWFEKVYVAEDGPIEWATFGALLAGAAVSVWTLLHPARGHARLHAVTWAGLALLCLFVAGEEISWGQRVLGFSSPDLFVHNNSQRETNLHNLVVAGVKVNKLVFSKLAFVCASLYLLVLPVLQRRKVAVARVVDATGVPIPRLRHIVAIAVTFALVAIIPSHKRDELNELGASAIFVLILAFSRNIEAIRAARRRRGRVGGERPAVASGRVSSGACRQPGRP